MEFSSIMVKKLYADMTWFFLGLQISNFVLDPLWILSLYDALWITRKSYMLGSGTSWPLKMGPIGCPETSITMYLRYVTSNNRDVIDYFH